MPTYMIKLEYLQCIEASDAEEAAEIAIERIQEYMYDSYSSIWVEKVEYHD